MTHKETCFALPHIQSHYDATIWVIYSKAGVFWGIMTKTFRPLSHQCFIFFIFWRWRSAGRWIMHKDAHMVEEDVFDLHDNTTSASVRFIQTQVIKKQGTTWEKFWSLAVFQKRRKHSNYSWEGDISSCGFRSQHGYFQCLHAGSRCPVKAWGVEMKGQERGLSAPSTYKENSFSWAQIPSVNPEKNVLGRKLKLL